MTEEGIHEILYRSRDFADNVEDPETLIVKIDKSALEVGISFDKSARTIMIGGMGQTTSTTVSRTDNRYIIQNAAGHTTTLTFDAIRERKASANAVLAELRYNGGSQVVFKRTRVDYSWTLNKAKDIIALTQKLTLNGKATTAKWNAASSKTVVTRPNGTKTTVDGLLILQLVTDKGMLLVKP